MEECAGLAKLTRTQERVLIDCFRAVDEGVPIETCSARFPEQEERLRGYLGMRNQLLALKATAPSPVAFASGREALLARVVRPLANGHPGSIDAQGHAARGPFWRPAARVAIAGALLFAVAGCTLGVSATAGDGGLAGVLPDIPTVQPPYPFPKLNDGPPIVVPTDVPSAPADLAATPVPNVEPTAEPDASPSDGATDDEKKPAKTDDPNAGWVPPQNANEQDLPVDVETPTPTAEPGQHDGEDSEAKPSDGDDPKDSDVLPDSTEDSDVLPDGGDGAKDGGDVG